MSIEMNSHIFTMLKTHPNNCW